ncbi:hypothetical protein BD289DRAFT_72803 [Coniella lustricola]|uniref:Uncharacterized protein n=1 Tax=Coniella lustricola TaxID=2025994 RepID=A0A2T2ZZM4_9PEZI|nr:hypothetical protein BD289DRAFT_72803 [Coniella lustricola]
MIIFLGGGGCSSFFLTGSFSKAWRQTWKSPTNRSKGNWELERRVGYNADTRGNLSFFLFLLFSFLSATTGSRTLQPTGIGFPVPVLRLSLCFPSPFLFRKSEAAGERKKGWGFFFPNNQATSFFFPLSLAGLLFPSFGGVYFWADFLLGFFSEAGFLSTLCMFLDFGFWISTTTLCGRRVTRRSVSICCFLFVFWCIIYFPFFGSFSPFFFSFWSHFIETSIMIPGAPEISGGTPKHLTASKQACLELLLLLLLFLCSCCVVGILADALV